MTGSERAGRKRRHGPIVIVDYDPDWPVQFESIKSVVSAALGDLVVAIEHVGSTSVPGLPAKPIIDFDMAVPEPRDVAAAIQRLAAIGYIHRGDLGIQGREAFDPPADRYPQHPYLVTANGREFRRHVAFRDRLRVDSALRTEYAALKRDLASRYPHDGDAYWSAKSVLIHPVLDEELGAGH